MWIATLDEQWFIHELRGVMHVSWVAAKDKAFAAPFPKDKSAAWLEMMEQMTGKRLKLVKPYS